MSKKIIEESLKHLNSLVRDGKLLDAFEKYYGEEVEMQENNFVPTIGKANIREQFIYLNS